LIFTSIPLKIKGENTMEISTANITKKYKNKTAVDNISLTVTPGITALLGVNGSGKTTLLRMLTTVLKPDSGTVFFNGSDICRNGDEYRAVLGYLPQNFGYYREFTALDFMLYLAALKGIKSRDALPKADKFLEFAGLSDVKKKKIKTFSGGMVQRLGIAQALINDPQVLVLDEPTSGLDPKERIRFRKLLEGISKDKIIIYSTHIVSDIASIADRVLLMDEGRIAEDTTADKISEICVKYFGEDSDIND